jgi:hypothetical protein
MNGLEGMGLKMALAQRWAEYAEALEWALNTICIPADVYMQDAGAVALAEEAVAWARQLLGQARCGGGSYGDATGRVQVKLRHCAHCPHVCDGGT